ncbi:MAG: hypothetical protein J5851_07110 [Oscillospiraceae bacterium]|nr:hypothetical protein [Oscillospiraceae bacterium]
MTPLIIGNKEYELCYNVKAMRDIEALCGSIDSMYAWMSEGSMVDNLEKTVQVVQILVNGGIYKHNCEIALGMKNGEKREFFEGDVLACLYSASDLHILTDAMISAIGADVPVEVPDAVAAEEEDPDLALVPSYSKEKAAGNLPAGADTTGSGSSSEDTPQV